MYWMEFLKEHKELKLPPDFDLEGFERYLCEVWLTRAYSNELGNEATERENGQQFFSFGRHRTIKATQHVGFIQYGGLNLTVYPKLFSKVGKEEVQDFYRHLVYWLSYCRKIHFPFTKIAAYLDQFEDFPEALIFYFSKYTLELLQRQPFSRFELVEEELPYLKGRLLTSQYINQQVARGHYHRLSCEHEPFLFDNLLNRIIKQVARRLIRRCKFKETWFQLEQILFILEEVEDAPVTASDCNKVRLNQLFSDYEECLDMCRFFLSQQQLQATDGYDRQLCFLLPMNYVFEDFICGFIEAKFSGRFKVKYKQSGWLTDERVFQIKNDLVLLNKTGSISLIIDTKYKDRSYADDAKKGINQSDLYQMIAYALRNNCRKVLLLYPELGTVSEEPIIHEFNVSSPMYADTIRVFASNLSVTCETFSCLDNKVNMQLDALLTKISSL